jgi:hypothetical protein
MNGNSFFGVSRNTGTFLLLLAATILAVVVGALVVVVAALRPLVFRSAADTGVVPVNALLLTIIVLLLAIFVLLVMMWRCSCGGKRDAAPDLLSGLLPFLPLLNTIPSALRATATALEHSGQALGWIDDGIGQAGETLRRVTTDPIDHFAVDIGDFDTHPGLDWGGVSWSYVGNRRSRTTTPLATVRQALLDTGSTLASHTVKDPALAAGAVSDLRKVGTDLHQASVLLKSIADTLDPP